MTTTRECNAAIIVLFADDDDEKKNFRHAREHRVKHPRRDAGSGDFRRVRLSRKCQGEPRRGSVVLLRAVFTSAL